MFNVENWRTNKKNLESTIGRLNHAGYIIPQSRYFLNRLRDLLKRCKQYGPQMISVKEIKDIELWIRLLSKVSTKGVDINNITLSRATDTTFSDACETGIGCFSTDGMAWRYALPKEMRAIFSINVLEFLAATITIYMVLQDKGSNRKILAFTDNSSALGWMYKASFHSDQETHDDIARFLADVCIKHDSSLYSQHIKLIHNMLADSLSCDTHIPDNQLTFMLKTLFPEQAAKNFKLRTLPPKLVSWLHSLKPSLIRKQ